jgi:hypothetical protein
MVENPQDEKNNPITLILNSPTNGPNYVDIPY